MQQGERAVPLASHATVARISSMSRRQSKSAAACVSPLPVPAAGD